MTHTSMFRSRLSRALLITSLCMGGLTACAPEPGGVDASAAPQSDDAASEFNGGTGAGDDQSTVDTTAEQARDETVWSGAEREPEKNTRVPEGFPASFPLPAEGEIDDVGARGDGLWFVVFRASSATEASTMWNAIITSGQFDVQQLSDTVEGGLQAVLESDTLSVQALTIPQPEGAVLLSYGIEELAK